MKKASVSNLKDNLSAYLRTVRAGSVVVKFWDASAITPLLARKPTLRSHPPNRRAPLRAADSLQLAAALVACDHGPLSLPFVCLNIRLARAAQREGFEVIGE